MLFAVENLESLEVISAESVESVKLGAARNIGMKRSSYVHIALKK